MVRSDEVELEDEIPVLIINSKVFETTCNAGTEQKKKVPREYRTPERVIVPFLPEVHEPGNKIIETKL